MKTKNILNLILFSAILFCVAACNSNKTGEKEKVATGHVVDTAIATSKPWTVQDAEKAAEAAFNKAIPEILTKYDAALDVQELHSGDFTGDGLADVVVYFNLSPKDGGNAAVGQGLILYKNTGSDIVMLGKFEPDYLFTFEDITDGKIHIEKLDYAPEDGHCCPSIKTPQLLNIDGENITAIDVNQNQL